MSNRNVSLEMSRVNSNKTNKPVNERKLTQQNTQLYINEHSMY